MTPHEQYFVKAYDSADDGPEAGIIRYFIFFPEGSEKYELPLVPDKYSLVSRCDSKS